TMDRSTHTSAIHVTTGSGTGYQIAFEPLEEAPALLAEAGLQPGKCLLVTDENVAHLHCDRLQAALMRAGWHPMSIVVPPGEASKSQDVLATVYDHALGAGLDRRTPLFALGGGVVGDLAGYAAATLLRGIPLVHFPTTLISQVDSAIGGKTGINHPRGKNLIGAFHQPRLVVSDPSTLETLSDREWASGLAEVVKHGLISDRELFDFLVANWDALLARRGDVVDEMVPRAVRVKTRVVEADERELGLRANLNFGHTFGHAIERVAGYGTFTHGEAVVVGMQVALYLSADFHPDLALDEALALVRRIPVEADPSRLSFDRLLETMKVDKKTEGGRIRFVLLRKIGEAYVRDDVGEREMRRAWERAIGS
ncbi:MAG TPA: 3-dehydroquinate synthase, partial [Rhodothermales bacterium]